MTRAAVIPTVFTPASLAERWRCSKTTIIRMMKRGDLPRLDFPLIRFSLKDVENIEQGVSIRSAGKIYVIAGAGLVKIGYTMDPIYRLRGLAATSPVLLELLCAFDGTIVDEKLLHQRFAAQRAHGEWFKKEGDLGDWIASGFPR